MTQPTWTYQGNPITGVEDMPENTYGFIYQVTHLPTGKMYIGKKVLYFERNVKLGKKELALLTDKRTSKKKKVIKESDWKTYYGSQKEILDLVKQSKQEEFKREILEFVPSKKLLTYYECKHLFINEVLETRNNYINDNILGKFYTKDFF